MVFHKFPQFSLKEIVLIKSALKSHLSYLEHCLVNTDSRSPNYNILMESVGILHGILNKFSDFQDIKLDISWFDNNPRSCSDYNSEIKSHFGGFDHE